MAEGVSISGILISDELDPAVLLRGLFQAEEGRDAPVGNGPRRRGLAAEGLGQPPSVVDILDGLDD